MPTPDELAYLGPAAIVMSPDDLAAARRQAEERDKRYLESVLEGTHSQLARIKSIRATQQQVRGDGLNRATRRRMRRGRS